MKRTLVVAVVLVLIAAVAGGTVACANGDSNATEPPDHLSVDASQAGTKVEIAAGGSLTVTLDSNATTGFQWQLAGSMDEAVLEFKNRQYQPPDDALDGVVGAGGQEVWTFKAVGPGESTIDLEYSQPWEGGTKAAETFDLTVVVE